MSTQPLAYLTTDALSAAEALTLALKHGVELELVEPRDLPRLERERVALIIDWDYLPEDDRSRLLENRALNIVAAHGFGLKDSLALFLTRGGTVCGRRLDHHTFAKLMGRAGAA